MDVFEREFHDETSSFDEILDFEISDDLNDFEEDDDSQDEEHFYRSLDEY